MVGFFFVFITRTFLPFAGSSKSFCHCSKSVFDKKRILRHNSVENNVGFIKENGVRKNIQFTKKNNLGFMDWIVLLKIASLKAIRTFHVFFRT